MSDHDLFSGDEPSLSGTQPRTDDVRLGGDSALLHVIDSLNHADPNVRQRAAFMLAAQGDTRAYEALVRVYQEGQPSLRASVLRALGRLGDARALDLLVACVTDEQMRRGIRLAAADALGDLGDPRAVDPLLQLLHSQPTQRRSGFSFRQHWNWHASRPTMPLLPRRFIHGVVFALMRLRDPRMVPEVLSILRERPWWIVDSSVTPAMINFLRSMLGDDLLPYLLEQAQQNNGGAFFVLAHLRDQSVVPELCKLLDQWMAPGGKSVHHVLDTLRAIGGPVAADCVLGHFEKLSPANPRYPIRDFMTTVAELDGPGAIKPLSAWLEIPAYALDAAVALASTGLPGAAAPLLAMLEATRREHRIQKQVALIRILGKVNRPEIIEALKASLQAPLYVIRSSAVQALTMIGSPEALAAISETRRTP